MFLDSLKVIDNNFKVEIRFKRENYELHENQTLEFQVIKLVKCISCLVLITSLFECENLILFSHLNCRI